MTEKTVLVLQGGGALGAYQGGVYKALHAAGYQPDWLAGISIGSINAAIIAGNPPEQCLDKLHAFWKKVSVNSSAPPFFWGDMGRAVYNEVNAASVASFGVEGFFKPRNPAGNLNPFVSPDVGDLGFYDTSPLRDTLLELVDFDRINHSGTRLSVGAVNVQTGNFVYFDSQSIKIKPEHIMASGALPEGFPPIEIDGEWFWDGGLVSNTPLQYVIDQQAKDDMCIFQIDLFSARDNLPSNMSEVSHRIKDIRFSSRTRLNTDVFKKTQEVRYIVKKLLDDHPDTKIDADTLSLLHDWSCDSAVTVAQLIYRKKDFHNTSKDYDFSRLSLEEHWAEGEKDAEFMLQQDTWKKRERPDCGVQVFDFNRHRKD